MKTVVVTTIIEGREVKYKAKGILNAKFNPREGGFVVDPCSVLCIVV